MSMSILGSSLIWRTVAVYSVGTHGSTPDCTGNLGIHFNGFATSDHVPGLVPGSPVRALFWSRDTGSPGGAHLTDAVHFTMGP